MKQPSILEWYRILRAHRRWTIFQAIRYAPVAGAVDISGERFTGMDGRGASIT